MYIKPYCCNKAPQTIIFIFLIVFNLFLIYNQKHYYASSFNKLYKVFVYIRAPGSYSCT